MFTYYRQSMAHFLFFQHETCQVLKHNTTENQTLTLSAIADVLSQILQPTKHSTLIGYQRRMVRNTAGGSEFVPKTTQQLTWLKTFTVFSELFKKKTGIMHKIGNDLYLSHNLVIIFDAIVL